MIAVDLNNNELELSLNALLPPCMFVNAMKGSLTYWGAFLGLFLVDLSLP